MEGIIHFPTKCNSIDKLLQSSKQVELYCCLPSFNHFVLPAARQQVGIVEHRAPTSAHYFISDMIKGTQHVGSSSEELHPPGLLVLQLSGDGGPVRYQPGGRTVSHHFTTNLD